MNYPVGDFLIRFKNAALSRAKEFSASRDKKIFAVASVLKKERYLLAHRKKTFWSNLKGRILRFIRQHRLLKSLLFFPCHNHTSAGYAWRCIPRLKILASRLPAPYMLLPRPVFGPSAPRADGRLSSI